MKKTTTITPIARPTLEEVCNEAHTVNLESKKVNIREYFAKYKRLSDEKLGIDHDINDMLDEMCSRLSLDKDVMKNAFKLAAKEMTLAEYETKSFEIKAFLEILQSV